MSAFDSFSRFLDIYSSNHGLNRCKTEAGEVVDVAVGAGELAVGWEGIRYDVCILGGRVGKHFARLGYFKGSMVNFSFSSWAQALISESSDDKTRSLAICAANFWQS